MEVAPPLRTVGPHEESRERDGDAEPAESAGVPGDGTEDTSRQEARPEGGRSEGSGDGEHSGDSGSLPSGSADDLERSGNAGDPGNAEDFQDSEGDRPDDAEDDHSGVVEGGSDASGNVRHGQPEGVRSGDSEDGAEGGGETPDARDTGNEAGNDAGNDEHADISSTRDGVTPTDTPADEHEATERGVPDGAGTRDDTDTADTTDTTDTGVADAGAEAPSVERSAGTEGRVQDQADERADDKAGDDAEAEAGGEDGVEGDDRAEHADAADGDAEIVVIVDKTADGTVADTDASDDRDIENDRNDQGDRNDQDGRAVQDGEGDEDPAGAARDEEDEEPRERVRETPLPAAVSKALSSALTAVRIGVTDLTFGLDLPGAEEARKVQGEILAQLDDYVIPRVHTSTAPALIVVAGSTGAGKSTLLNTLANAKVSATGVRRPTTGTPVLACHPDDHEWFAKGGLLGGLRRLSEPDPEAASGGLVLVSTDHLPVGVALLDTPDIDSVVEEHHEIAHRMLDVADLWIFVTTAARYADAPAWRLLRLAKERGARLAIVLSRVPPKSREVIDKHFVRMLTEYGLGEVDRFVVNESKVVDGMLPDDEVTELRRWLTELSVDERRREQAVRATLDGVLNSFRTRVPALAKQLEAQVALRRELRADVDTAYARALAEIDENTGNGSLLQGEVLARWQDFAGSGDLMRTLHLRRPGRFAGKASQQAPERLSALKSALRAGLESVVVSAAHRAAEEAASRWLNRPGTQDVLEAVPGSGRASDELLRRTGRTIGAWQDHIIELIRTEGVTKRAVARVVSFDAESLSLILTIGLLGYGSSDARNGPGALPQRLVHALLGAESLRNIGVKARSDLRARIGVLFDDETARYVQALDGAGIPDEAAATRLYQATYNLEVAR
ncbi:GTPase [Streptosporangium sp. NPDC023615]|uniref:GTPase n=1 Tax=Streptosporangium sp. NPDC023615 TaxID=3154794 RepID=UPI0034321FC2